jgi:hypothetical protein
LLRIPQLNQGIADTVSFLRHLVASKKQPTVRRFLPGEII